MDFLSLLGSAIWFVLGLLWSLIWFVLRDLVSTLLWALIGAWLILSVRYRSASSGLFALARWGRVGLWTLWRWIRRKPVSLLTATPKAKARTPKRKRRRVPVGYMSVSDQLNMLLLVYLAALLYL